MFLILFQGQGTRVVYSQFGGNMDQKYLQEAYLSFGLNLFDISIV